MADTETSAPMALTDPGALHRLAMVVPEMGAATPFFVDVLGARSMTGMLDGGDRARREEIAASEGADMRLLWLGGVPIVLLGPVPGADGADLAGKFITRFGPGVHSLAWEITDMWALEHRLRDRGISITGVSVEGRHFFMHPRDTHGLLIEWCDGLMGAAPAPASGVVSVTGLSWVTGVVADADATAAFLGELAVTSSPASPRAAGDPALERTRDVIIGPVTVRLVTPTSPDSRYHAVLERGARWASAAFAVDDLDRALDALDAAGIPTVARDDDRAWTDPAATLGIPFEWTN
jgi:hypothetical protein